MPAGDMMSTAVRTIMLALVASWATACAQGGSSDPSDANGSASDAKPIDAPNNPGNDAPVQPADATVDSMPADAMVDALPPGSNLFCSTTAMCGVGECCFTFFGQSSQGACVTGAEVVGVCFPQ